ncbi:MAG: ketopantoate reductase family protein [Pseudolabrys sp.]|nr:ketopantoate reductase family protein [Pseudolabrys sp.]MDP2296411.1 ketopantoate reductase family protein [Pseudolabrys sp.]
MAGILIVGCGAIGGLFASALAKVTEVTALDANAEHVAAIKRDGLKVIGKSPRTARFAITGDVEDLRGKSFDAILFLIKSKATAAVLAQLRPVLTGNPVLVTLQNGMGNAEVLLDVPDAIVARGATMNAGRYVEPGVVENLIEGKTWLGPMRGSVQDIAALGATLNEAGMTIEIVADPMGAVWSKFVFNCVMNPLGALMMGDNAARHNVPEMRALIDDMAAECMTVIEALGGRFAFPPMEFVAKIRAGEVPLSKHAGSMALDIARGAPTEIDELTGFIVREGDRLGIAVPNCRAVTRLVKGLEFASQTRVANPR